MAHLYCKGCGWTIGQFYSLLDLEGKKGDALIEKFNASHSCAPPPSDPTKSPYTDLFTPWIDPGKLSTSA